MYFFYFNKYIFKHFLKYIEFAEKMIDEKDVFNQNNLKNFFAIFYNKETKTLSLYDIIEVLKFFLFF